MSWYFCDPGFQKSRYKYYCKNVSLHQKISKPSNKLTVRGRLQAELENKGKVQLGNLKSGRGSLRFSAFHYKV